MLIDFTKPKKVKVDYGFEDGPDGGYMPQMSDDDAKRWKAKIINKGKENARIELRKSFDTAQVFIVVALDGWDLSSKFDYRDPPRDYFVSTRGLNVRMSMNGPLKLTFEQFAEFQQAVEEARQILEEE